MNDETKSYALPLKTTPSLDAGTHARDLAEFREFMEGIGIRTKNSRIERYITYLTALASDEAVNPEDIFKNSKDAPCESHLDWFLYVLREAHELMWILKGLKVSLPKGVEKKLEVIVGGRDFAALDKDSISRNTQFELRIASYFCQAGCAVDISTETDVIATSGRERFYIECKRVGGAGQLGKRIEEAYAQLKLRSPKSCWNRTIFKCIAIDVTKVAFPHNGLTFAMTPEHSRDVIQEKLLEISETAKKYSFFKGKNDFSNIWFQIHIPSLIKYPQETVTRLSSLHLFNAKSRKENRARKEFQRIFEAVSIFDARSNPAKTLRRRTSITVPAGTTFFVDEEIFLKAINGGDLDGEANDKEFAKIEINGREHIYYVADLLRALPLIENELRDTLEADPMRSRTNLVLRMHLNRHPYDDDPV